MSFKASQHVQLSSLQGTTKGLDLLCFKVIDLLWVLVGPNNNSQTTITSLSGRFKIRPLNIKRCLLHNMHICDQWAVVNIYGVVIHILLPIKTGNSFVFASLTSVAPIGFGQGTFSYRILNLHRKKCLQAARWSCSSITSFIFAGLASSCGPNWVRPRNVSWQEPQSTCIK